MKKILLSLMALMAFACYLNGQVIWQQLTYPEPGIGVSAMAMDNNGLLVLGLDDDIYSSQDDGITWNHCTNWPGYMPNSIVFNASHQIFIGTYTYGIYRSTDGGSSFTPVNNGLTSMNIWSLLVLDNNEILAGTPLGLFRSVNNGDLWTAFGTGLPDDGIMKLTKGNDGKIFAGMMNDGVFKSLDNGATWGEVNNGFPDTIQVTALLAIPGTNVVYAGLYPQGLFRSLDDGLNWADYNTGLPFPKEMKAGRSSSVDALVRVMNFIVLIIYYYGAYINDLDFDLDNAWVLISEGLPADPTTTSLVAGPQNQLFIGASLQGLYHNAYPVLVPPNAQVTSETSLTVIPNPVTKEATFTLYVHEQCTLSIDLFNSVGQKIQNITRQSCTKGMQQIHWTPSGIESGVYYYLLTAGEHSARGKVIYNR